MIIFGLGSNLGNRLGNLRSAVEKLKSLGKIEITSDVFETEAWGGIEQPNFLNACVGMKFSKNLEKNPLEILKFVKNFEIELGRVPSVRWGARKIDIDILLIDEIIFNTPDLTIPHANLHDRLFVLEPLEQIEKKFPNWIHPLLKLSIPEMKSKLANSQAKPLRITNL